MRYKKINIDHILPSILKPARYSNQELNSYHNEPTEDKVTFCLAFPDVYEVGSSHLGIKILYTILNNEANTMADRVYSPWPDFQEKLTAEKIPLFSIESRVPIKDFDVIGITLQTELTFTNVLGMLDTAMIPLRNKDRNESDPIILAGGPCASNPEPLAPFIDAFLIGDGEEAIIEIKNILFENKSKTRLEKLKHLARITGVYVPELYNEEDGIITSKEYPYPVKIRKYMKFSDNELSHKNQLVPWMKSTHDRYVSEIMRGCSRGCRFCHAGMFYRPVREKSPEAIVDQLVKEIRENGWHEAALTSLSSSDYTCIRPVLNEIHQRIKTHKAKLSLPSLRVDSLDDELLKLMKEFGTNGITIAPEAGSQRMRDVINKQISEEEILNGVKIALENGWQLVKLYFMIGLPNETEEDVMGIIDLVEKIIGMSGKKLKINITIAPFVPKPFTPFQWEPMRDKDYLLNMARNLKEGIKKYKFVKLRYHEIQSSMLESILTRGDRRIGDLIEQAYRLGAKYDGWDEYFDFDIWEKAAEDVKIDLNKYLGARATDSALVWDHIDIGIRKEFFLSEKKQAEKALLTPDCRTDKCSFCGVCDTEVNPIYAPKQMKEFVGKHEPEVVIENLRYFHYRVFYSKKSPLTFVSHLDTMRMIHRLIRVAKLPLGYSQGYTPHPKISLGPPLPIGVEGENEYFDLALYEIIDPKLIFPLLKVLFPEKMELKKMIPLPKKEMRPMEYYQFSKVELFFNEDEVAMIKSKIEAFNQATEWRFERLRKRKIKVANMKDLVHSITLEDTKVTIIKKMVGASIFDIIENVLGIPRDESEKIKIVRKELLHEIN